jgi:hypothetical protein
MKPSAAHTVGPLMEFSGDLKSTDVIFKLMFAGKSYQRTYLQQMFEIPRKIIKDG